MSSGGAQGSTASTLAAVPAADLEVADAELPTTADLWQAALALVGGVGDGGGEPSPSALGKKRCCVRLASTSAAADEVGGKRCASGPAAVVHETVAASAAMEQALAMASIAGGRPWHGTCEGCGQVGHILFSMTGEWSCAECEQARCAELLWLDD